MGDTQTKRAGRESSTELTPLPPTGSTTAPAGCSWWASCSIWLTEPSPGSSTPAQRWVSPGAGDVPGVPAAGCPLTHSPPAGAKLDDFADFTSFGLATALLLQPRGMLDGLLAIVYVLAVFARLCFFSSGKARGSRGWTPCRARG